MLVLESKCFVCLTNCNLYLDESDPLRFRNDLLLFSKYLKVFPGNEDDVYRDSTSLQLCKECFGVLNTFSKLLKQLEITQMKVDSCVKQIRDVMSRTPEQLNKAEFDGDKIEDFRKNLINQSSLHLHKSRSQPIVKVSRIQLSNKPANPPPSELPSSRFASSLNSIPLKNLKVEANEEDSDGIYGTEMEDDQIDININLPDVHESDDKATKNVACPFCRAVFPESCKSSNGLRKTKYGEQSLRKHLLQYHCEHYFPTHKQEFITDSEFRKIVAEILFKDFVDGKTSCVFCQKPFPPIQKGRRYVQAELRVKMHYVEKHFPILEKKLKEIQEDSKLSEKLLECNPQGRVCDCGVYLSNGPGLTAHTKLHCNLTEKQECFIPDFKPRDPLPSDVEETNEKGKVKCKRCGQVLLRRSARKHLDFHCKGLNHNQNSKQKMRPPPTKFIFTETQNPNKVKCNFCRTIFSRSWAKMHYKTHCKKLVKKVTTTPDDTTATTSQSPSFNISNECNGASAMEVEVGQPFFHLKYETLVS